jgi:NADH pyrophosphatase NudC (nudix superfamily)
MTKEEREKAIDLLDNMRGMIEDNQGNDYDFALKSGIEALETLEDFERAQIITGGRLNGRTYAYKRGLEDGKRKALEQEPCDKKGKWVFHEKSVSTGFKDLRECSYCHCYFRWEMPRNSYCPNCGAKMEVERD